MRRQDVLSHAGLALGSYVLWLIATVVSVIITELLIGDVTTPLYALEATLLSYMMIVPFIWAVYRSVRATEKSIVLPQLILLFLLLFFAVYFGEVCASYIYTHTQDAAFAGYEALSRNIPAGTHVQNFYVLITVVLAPIVEELLFRGVIYRELQQLMPPVVAAFLSSTLFAISHGTLVHIPLTFMVGCTLCCIFSATNKLRYAIVGHMFANAIPAFFRIYVPDFMLTLPVLCIAVGIVVALTFAYLSKYGKMTVKEMG